MTRHDESKLTKQTNMDSSSIHAISTDLAPAPVGPYNQAISAGEWLFCSGQIALEPEGGELKGGGDIELETHQVLRNLLAVLEKAGAKPTQVVRTTIYLKNLSHFEKVNSIYGKTFGEGVSPARACVEVSALPKGALVEIDCIAWLGARN